jgi:hypothetical protein
MLQKGAITPGIEAGGEKPAARKPKEASPGAKRDMRRTKTGRKTMRKILVATAALVTAIAFAAPANAGGNFSFNLGLGGWGPGWGPGYGGIYVGTPYYPQNNWAAHVDWCYDHKGPSYNPNTNTYISNSGKVKYCNSPFT